MRNFISALCALLPLVVPSVGWTIDENTARKIAEKDAGCSLTKRCKTTAMIDGDNWALVVWFIRGYRENGDPQFSPGGWVGFTIDQEGLIVEKTPGR